MNKLSIVIPCYRSAGTIPGVVEELTRVRSSIAHVSNELVVNERVVNTKAFSRYPVKVLAIIFIAGIFV
ncbi:MAG: hypothetical protein IKZ31_06855, partial [Lentisphaeria bacterium]|nr:hypothetical protein [Lentisphaeria bacterium]